MFLFYYLTPLLSSLLQQEPTTLTIGSCLVASLVAVTASTNELTSRRLPNAGLRLMGASSTEGEDFYDAEEEELECCSNEVFSFSVSVLNAS